LGASGADNFESKGYLPMKATAQWYADGNPVDLPDDFYSSKTYIDKTISFHEEEEDRDKPFFSYIAFQAIHAPIQAPEDFVQHYRSTYALGWDKLRQKRFEKAKQLGFIPESAELNEVFPQFEKWDNLRPDEQESYITDMAVTAGMLEAMDYHIGRYIDYLTKAGWIENTIFIVTSDNGPDGADYRQMVRWPRFQGYHRDFDQNGGRGYYGAIGPEFANALASPFSYFKYYTGEGGLRVPLIIHGSNLPGNIQTNEFCFFTDIAPTIYDIVGLNTSANKGYAAITGKSMLPHMLDATLTIYNENEGVGLEAANSSAYFLNGFKIVKNNIPLGDKQWHLFNLEHDPGETMDIASQQPALFQKMLHGYEQYANSVGVIKMPDGYSAEREVGRKSAVSIVKALAPFVLMVMLLIFAFYYWRKSRKPNII
jgi:arylsulfatase/uncharacterized sulfatase